MLSNVMSPAYVGALLALSVAHAAYAAPYPDKPVRVVVPNFAGTTTDVVARMVAPGMSAQLGNLFIVDNRGGADGSIGTELAAKATPDGYTLLVASTGTLTVMRHLRKDVAFDALKDFTPIGLLSVRAYLLVTHPGLPVKKLTDLIALAKRQPGRMSYASSGSGSSTHLAMQRIETMAGIDLRHVAYKGSPEAALAIVNGRVPVAMLSLRNALPYVTAQRLHALAITSMHRASQLPQIPTVAESGLAGFEALTWFALMTPARTPGEIVLRLSQALQEVVRSPAVQAQFERAGLEPGHADAGMMHALIKRDIEAYGKLMKASGVAVN